MNASKTLLNKMFEEFNDYLTEVKSERKNLRQENAKPYITI